jgi:predicted RecA/RadA family phage recombinase
LFSGDGVVESQKLGVQEISSVAGEAGEIFKKLAG